jgi:seryl-tRNA synthetase
MPNIDFVCQHPDIIRNALQKRHDGRNIDDILHLAEQRRDLVTRSDGLYTALDHLRSLPVEKREAQNVRIKAITEELRQLELQSSDLGARLRFMLLNLPNIPHASVKEDDGSTVGEEVRRWGEPFPLYAEPQSHWQLGEQLGILDAESGVRVAGSRFVTLKGAGARLERALISLMLDIHTREHGYLEVMPPQLVKRAVMISSGQLPKFEDQSYACTEDELYLNPTAEVPLIGMYNDTILQQEALPVRNVAWTTAFRREAGSASRRTRGLLRLHQFNEVELLQIVEPERSYEVLEQMVQHVESILQHLGLSYRVVALNASQLPFTSAKTFGIEVWMPALGSFSEVSLVSNCEMFQSQRAGIKYRQVSSARAAYVHTLNASGLMVGRTMAAILENYQQADGSVVIPKVLRPFMGISVIAPFS